MAFVDTVDTHDNVTAMGEPTDGQSGWHVELPDWNDDMAVEVFKSEIAAHKGERAVKTLQKYVDKYVKTLDIAKGHLQRVQTAANTINGVATTRLPEDNNLRNFKRATKKYFGIVDDITLQGQCTLLGLDYNSYATRDDVITALVAKSVELRG